MSNAIQVSRLEFAGTGTKRLVPFRSRREILRSSAILVGAIIVAGILQWWTRNPFVWLLLLVPVLVSAAGAILWPEPARFWLHGDATAIVAYLDQLLRADPEYQRSSQKAGETEYRRRGKGRFADARSYCVIALRGDAVEVRGSRDILRRLRFWSSRHFSQAPVG